MINFSKTKVMIFNVLKSDLFDYYFYFRGREIEITMTYYLGVLVLRAWFKLRHAF
jgi:hypothetical protein